jgi:hypothetical protein
MIVIEFMPVGNMPEWLQIEQKLNKLKGTIDFYLKKGMAIPDGLNSQYNQALEEYKNSKAKEVDGIRQVVKDIATEIEKYYNTEPAPKKNPVKETKCEVKFTFKERVLSFLEGRLNALTVEGLVGTDKYFTYHSLYNTINSWQE